MKTTFRLLATTAFVFLFFFGASLQPVHADACSDTCSEDYNTCFDNCDTNAVCEDSCDTTYTTCTDDCAAAAEIEEASATAKATAAAATAAGAEEAGMSYYDKIKRDGITFANVSADCKNDGNCTLNDIMQVFVNISNFIVGISGSLVLVVTVYGGFLWLTSQGNSEQIEKGKTAMTGSIIGLLIIFGAFTAINLLTGALRGGTAGQQNLCEVVGPASGGHAGQGYACLDTSSGSGYDSTKFDCLPSSPRQCPGPDAIRCCIGKVTETTTTE